MLLAARTAQHEINNCLALTRGYVEMLVDSPNLPAGLRWQAEEALRGTVEAAETIQRLQQLTCLEETDWGTLGGSTIDLDRSTAPQAKAA